MQTQGAPNPTPRQPGFAIRFEPVAPSADGTAVGALIVGGYREEFHADLSYWSAEQYQQSWRAALTHLLTDRPSVALMTWMADPASQADRRAYVLYRRGEAVHVQEAFFLVGDNPAQFDADGQVTNIELWAAQTDDGRPIDDWQTTVDAVRAFLACPADMPANA
jgi:hypothetical protein